MLEIAFPDALRAHAVGDGSRGLFGGKGNSVTGLKAGFAFGPEFRFDTKDACFRPQVLDGSTDSADHSTSAHAYQYRSHIGKVFDDLHAYGALARDDGLIVVWRHQRVAVFRGQFFSSCLAFVT